MTLWTIFFEASLINKIILLVLVLLSVFSWTIIIDRWRFFHASKKADLSFFQSLKGNLSNPDTIHSLASKRRISVAARVYLAAENSMRQRSSNDRQAWLEALGLERDLLRVKGERGLPLLAIVASASPFIGLLGTVWGVMIAFLRLGNLQGQPALEVVGPGIAEALIATAAGLFAAIPATIAYNAFLAQLRQMMQRCDEFSRRFIFLMNTESVR